MMTQDHITEADEMVVQLEQIAQLAPQVTAAAREISDTLADWYLGAVEHGDGAFADAIVLIANRADIMHDAVGTQSAFITALIEMNTALADQHDGVVQELSDLDNGLEAIKRNHFPAHPKLNGLYDGMAESHNAAFWESLPYDFAEMLGEPWQNWDASSLYTALTIDIDEVDESLDGYTPTELQAFRGQLLTMIRQLTRRD